MRLLTYKIHRAFPELDRFDDATCEIYVRAALSPSEPFLRRCLRTALQILVFLFIALATLISMILVAVYIVEAMNISSNIFGSMFWVGICLIILFCVPAIVCLIARDRYLRIRIRAQLRRTTRPGCHYNLLGIPIQGLGPICPECGLHLNLALVDPDIASAYHAAAGLSAAAAPPTTPRNRHAARQSP